MEAVAQLQDDPQDYKTTGVAARVGDLVGLQAMVWSGKEVVLYMAMLWSGKEVVLYRASQAMVWSGKEVVLYRASQPSGYGVER
ncbi:hypothetical protein ACOMHN_033690 [Nucella lapillus]